MLFTSVVIGQSNYFGFGFTTLNWKSLYKTLLCMVLGTVMLSLNVVFGAFVL